MEFFSYRYNENISIIDNCLKIDGLAQELRASDEIIKDEWVITRILNVLPDKYSHFHSAWDSVASPDKTLSNLFERLKQEELRSNRLEESVENALVSKGKMKNTKTYNKKNVKQNFNKTSNQNNKQTERRNCFKCGKPVHLKNECQNKPCQAYYDYCKKKYPCNNCQELGHFAKECPNSDKTKKAFVTVSLTASQIENISDNKYSWYQDSGATHHMTGNWITDMRILEEPANIKIGDHRY